MPENEPPSGTPPTPSQPTAPAPDQKEREARMWNMWCHMSALAGLFFPLGNVLGPLIIWQMKKHDFPSTDAHGKAAVNFQITVAIVELASVVLGFILSFIWVGFLIFLVTGAAVIASIIFAVIAGMKANDGLEYKYPWSLTLIK